MCLAVPVKVKSLTSDNAIVETGGVEFGVSRVLVDNIKIGDFVLVHAGFIIEKISKVDAEEKFKLWKEYQDKIKVEKK